MQDLDSDFLADTAQGVAQLDGELKALTERPEDTGLLAAIFRHVHSIKGTCGFLGLQSLEETAHDMETVLVQIRNRAEDSAILLDRLYGFAAALRGIVAALGAEAGDGAADIWMHLPRLVDELSHRLGKETELRISGDVAALDAPLLIAARDSLIHIIRNAIDHGIETPAARQTAGKPVRGVLGLSVRREDDHVVVEISDDGRGLDLPALRRQVGAGGVAMKDVDIGRQVFAPGVSTAGRVTTLSGRGVGLDAVQVAVRDLGGSVHVASEPGQGTCFTLRLPASITHIRPRRTAIR